ncbi:MAG: DUF3011 domain-containing protein [Proteobacteria bacterium]|uniref:DUF3011 domain-containing protein n=1 Tax=Rudaea sp. TaxID=2136325 RepID=UPI001DE8B52B|nr:DUF3011 domain-containing protein [Pseudomonadota bacterium]MBS0566997.1 DUF3011 domain-containing protein [Pseudomonadota bacterium]
MLVRILAMVLVLAAGAMSSGTARAQYYGDDRGYGGGMIECKSSGYNYQRCPVPWRDARIARQLSDTQCRRGQNWGFDRRGFVWVDRGCAARFVDVDGSGGGGYPGGPTAPPWQPGPGWNQRFSIRCESNDGQNRFCQVDVGGGGRVYLERQESHTPCIDGQTWGWNRAGVWVAQGCRGVFTIDRRW